MAGSSPPLRDDHSLERIVRSNHFNNLVEITRECQDHGVTISTATIHHRLQEMGLLQLYSSDQAPSELLAEASCLVNRKEELNGGLLDKSALHRLKQVLHHIWK